jgi:uncharacterized protein
VSIPAFNIIAKPAADRCNLRCSYCFYLGKTAPGTMRMSEATLARYIQQMGESQQGAITFGWQGGEPTLLGLDWFRRAVKLQRQLLPGREVRNALQTNGTLLTDEWGAFLAAEGFLVGISIDGPQDLHDAQRIDARGGPSWADVMRGLAVLQRHRVAFNTLTCAGRLSEGRGLEVYEYLKGIGSTYHQYIPLVHATEPWSVTAEGWGQFMVSIFDHWARNDIGTISVQWFDDALNRWTGKGSACVHSETCGTGLALEHDGSVYACDHFVRPEWLIGNLQTQPLAEIASAEKQRQFGQAKRDGLHPGCLTCPVLAGCNGGCPKDRDEHGLNRLCAGYKHYFSHIAPYLAVIAQAMRQGKPAAAAMETFRK